MNEKEKIPDQFSIRDRAFWLTNLLLSLLISYIQFVHYIIPSLKQIVSLEPVTSSFGFIGFMLVPMIAYLLIVWVICITVYIFRPLTHLKTISEKGLVRSFCQEFFTGIIAGMILGLFFSLYLGSMMGLPLGLMSFLLISFVEGLTTGVVHEFRRSATPI